MRLKATIDGLILKVPITLTMIQGCIYDFFQERGGVFVIEFRKVFLNSIRNTF